MDVAHATAGSFSAASTSACELGVEVGLARKRHRLVVGEDHRGAARAGGVGDDVDACGLDLDEVDLGVDAGELLAERDAVGEARGRVDDLARRGASVDAGPAVNTAVRLPASGSSGRRRSSHATTGTRFTSWMRRRSFGAVRPGHGQDDQVGDEDPVGVQVAGDHVRALQRGGDEHARVGGDGRERGAAAVADEELGPTRCGDARALRARSTPRSRPRARRRSGGSRPSRRRRRPPSPGSRTRRARPRAPARRARRRTAATRRPRAPAARRGPSRRRPRRASRPRAGRACPVTAVLPTRLPVPVDGDRRHPDGRERRADRAGSRRPT